MTASASATPDMKDLFKSIWDSLRAGAGAGRSPFSVLQAATVGVDGNPKVRTIVLRDANEELARLSFHTDIRSGKVRELRARPAISMHGYDAERLVQIRMEGIASFVTDEAEKLAVWNSSRPRTLILYRSPVVSGSVIDDPAQAAAPDAADPMLGYENFCLVHVSVRHIDYLDLSNEPHHRAQFHVRDDGAFQGQWVAP
ncbi:MAG: pyridoxamine 5'-phosphate oxidase family protein [Pseudomonadota bacterium]|nr:pyridoxamine 5'-phosphate oxidase family protein [Pseudomonadota bacterium]